MREILFRGKRPNNGEWVEGGIYCGNFTWIITTDASGQFTQYMVDPSTVGQYTGLTDETGKRIFEGDIVDILTENEEIGTVTYEDGGFWVEADGFCVDFHSNINGTDLEVIGNIHDNPELVKEG